MLYIILTASDKWQAEGFRLQLDLRKKQRLLPDEAEVLVIADPDSGRVGSGGSTLHVLKELISRFGMEVLIGHILCIHAGGKSSRIPQYTALGKVFAPTDPDTNRTILDHDLEQFIPWLSRQPSGMLVMSGDVLLNMSLEKIMIHDHGATVLSVPASVMVGRNHGVFIADEQGQVYEFLHKQPMQVLSGSEAIHSDGNVWIDTGAVFFTKEVLLALYRMTCNDPLLISHDAVLSLYGDFLYPMAGKSTYEQYLREASEGKEKRKITGLRKVIWDTLHEFPLFIAVEPFGQFQHLGTSDEVRRFMTKDRGIAIQNSQIEEDVLLGKGSFIESSVLHKGTEIGTDCIISQTELFGQMIPNECVIHMLPLSDGTYVTRIWGTTDNPKKSSWFGKPLMNGKTLWESQLFLPQKTKRASVDEALRVRSKFIEEGQMPNQENIKFLSLADGYRYADMREIVSWQQEVLLSYRLKKTKDKILKATEKWPNAVSFLKDSADVKLPLRINFAGGWTDTPPYCLDKGGAILNIPILINDQKPVHVQIKRLEEPIIILESKDLGQRKEYSDWDELITCNDPEDPFSLSKAALIVCGITSVDRVSTESLQEKLKKLGGGIYLNTEVIDVPKGSGLGTSSILGAACIQAILECFGCPYTKEQLIQWVLCMEQLMSTGGGWQDQAGALSDGLCLIISQPEDKQNLRFEKVLISEEIVAELEDRLILVYTGQRRLTRNRLRKIMGRHINGEIEAEVIFERFKELAYDMKRSLEQGDLVSFAKEMNEHWDLLKRLDPESTNPEIEEIMDGLSGLTAGRMICGAGGGGYLQILLEPGVTKENVEERLSAISSITQIKKVTYNIV